MYDYMLGGHNHLPVDREVADALLALRRLQIARRVAPDARVVYVDNDPEVIAHGVARVSRIGVAYPDRRAWTRTIVAGNAESFRISV